MKTYDAAVLGATGAVGQKFVQLLEDHPWFRLTEVVGSDRHAGEAYGDAVRWAEGSPLPDGIRDLPLRTDVDGLEIELTQRLTTVSGGVSVDGGAAALDATVVVFVDDPGKWGPHSRFIESARLDQQGRFTIRGLPPGRYLAIAVGYLEPGEEQDPDLLETWRQGATTFTLSDGETHALNLRLSTS